MRVSYHGGYVAPCEADWADLLLVHSRRYLGALAAGTLTRAEERRMGLPWSAALVRRSRLAVQGTLNACSMALLDGIWSRRDAAPSLPRTLRRPAGDGDPVAPCQVR